MLEVPYSWIDRATHRIAFSSPAVQSVLADIEASLLKSPWRDQAVESPIFITSLPRSGTTLLLRLLSRVPVVSTPSYRDMPFVRAPVLWSRLSGRFQAKTAQKERAHGDGVIVDVDSPEAFEEVIWLARCRDQFTKTGISLLNAVPSECQEELAGFMRRIMFLRHGGVAPGARYISKNNANIARIGALQRAFPDARIVIPVREPLAQARSMLRQHTQFGALHAQQPFARRYMTDIGHFEFGDLHRPIQFDGLADLTGGYGPDQLEYWIGYWIAANRHLAKQAGLTLLCYEGFCDEGGPNFEKLCAALGLPMDAAAHEAARDEIRPQAALKEPEGEIAGLDVARGLYRGLANRCLVSGAA